MIDLRSNQLQARRAGGLDAGFCEVMDAAPVMIWVSGHDGRCVWFNKPWLTFTGRRMAQELGDGWARGVHPSDLDGCLRTYVHHFNSRQPFRMQYRLRHRDQTYHLIDDTGIPRHARNGEFLGFIGSCVDQQEYVEAREKLRSRLTEINGIAQAGELVVSIVHEFNQYLGAISSNGNAGLRWLDKGAAHHNKVRASLQSVIAAAHEGGDAVASILGTLKKNTRNKGRLDSNKLLDLTLPRRFRGRHREE